jgi:hypothetical protein
MLNTLSNSGLDSINSKYFVEIYLLWFLNPSAWNMRIFQ